MTNRSSANHLVALLAVPLLLGVAAPAGADWFGISVGGDDFAFSLGFGDWGPYGSAWSDPGWNVNYRVALDGYGQWVWVDGLGEVWYPSVAADWRPYTHGRWVYTSMGWTWVSYEPWGYFPHHYGEWALTGYGWVWVPGYTYRPAHVVWVGYGSHVGWYPCAPAGWSHSHRGFWRGYDQGFHDGARHGYRRGYDDGYWDGWHDARYATYVPWDRFTSDNVAHAALDSREVSRNLTRANAKPLQAAPARAEVSRRTGREVAEVRVEQRQIQVDGRPVTVARPEGATRSVAMNATETVERALTPTAARQAASRQERALEASSKPASNRVTSGVSAQPRGQASQATRSGARTTSSTSAERRTTVSQPSSASSRDRSDVVAGSTTSARGTAAPSATVSPSRSSQRRTAGTAASTATVQRQPSARQSPAVRPASPTATSQASGTSRSQPSASRQVRASDARGTGTVAPRGTATERAAMSSGSAQRRSAGAPARTAATARPQGASAQARASTAARPREAAPAQAAEKQQKQRNRRAPAGSGSASPERD
jgi:hypothetical protein